MGGSTVREVVEFVVDFVFLWVALAIYTLYILSFFDPYLILCHLVEFHPSLRKFLKMNTGTVLVMQVGQIMNKMLGRI